ncbi:MAG: carboxypeptidase M32 [Solirubrobacterales bacterium]
MEPAREDLERLRELNAEISDLGRARALLFWDERTQMPPAGQAGRAEQLATLVRIRHRIQASDELAALLERLEAAELADPIVAATVRITARDAAKARLVPAELRAEMARAASDGERAWREARELGDATPFLPALARNIELRRRYIECFDDVEHPYDALLDDFEPGARVAQVRPLLAELRAGLVPIVAAIAASDADVDDAPLQGTFAPEAQERVVKRVVAGLPLAEGTWRIDPTGHPFALSAAHGDVRLTTRYEPDDISYAIFSSIHEAGHGIYESGIPAELRRGPLGRPPSLGFHESQSRLWENWVGRSRPFLASLLPILREELPGRFDEIGPEDLHRAANRAGPSPIRVEADEVTYNLHIALRFELELSLFEGEIEPADLPEAWKELTRSYLGIEVAGDVEGILQDVHWAAGSFGYFPTYSLGNLIAAQLWEIAAREDPALTAETPLDGLWPLREWLVERLHRHAGTLLPAELARQVLGGPVEAEPLLRHLRAKFGALYGF